MDNSIHVAAGHGFVEEVRACLERGTSVGVRDGCGKTPLHRAAEKGHLGVVQFLIERGASVGERDMWGRTPLHRAARRDHLGVAQLLIEQKCDLEVKSDRGETPLLLAANLRRKDIVDLLLQSGADVHARGKYGMTFLHLASKKGWLDLVQLLVEKNCDLECKNDCGATPLLLAAFVGKKDIVDLFLTVGADVHARTNNGWTLFHFASGNGWLDVVQLCVEKKCDLDCKDRWGNTPLHEACRHKKKEIVKYLLQVGAKCNEQNSRNETAFTLAVKSDSDIEVVTLFLNHGFYLEQQDYLEVSRNCSLKESILTNPVLCTQAILNKFNNKYLPEFYEILEPFADLPEIEFLKIWSGQNVAREVQKRVEEEVKQEEETVNGEIVKSKQPCDITCCNPITLKMRCVQSLISHSSALKSIRKKEALPVFYDGCASKRRYSI